MRKGVHDLLNCRDNCGEINVEIVVGVPNKESLAHVAQSVGGFGG